MKIAIIPNLTKKDARKYTLQIIERLYSFGAQIFMHSEMKREFSHQSIFYCCSLEELIENCNMVLSVGGDGTIIHASKYACIANKPILGINVGRLGYVAELEVNELDNLKLLMNGHYTIENRMMLEVSFTKDGRKQTYQVLNDAVISRGSLSRILDLKVSYKQEAVCQYHADGLIVCTSTGSTAYSFASGGPIMDPAMEGMLLTPICPHSIFGRTVVFGADAQLSVVATSRYNSDIILTLDGDCVANIEQNQVIEIKRSALNTKLIKLKHRNFYEVVREKLGERSTCSERETSS